METHGQGHNYAVGRIEEAKTEDVVLDKFCQREEDNLKNIGGNVLLAEFLGSNISVEIYFF